MAQFSLAYLSENTSIFSLACLDKHRLNCGESLKNSVMQKPSPDGDEASVQSVASFGRAFSSENVSYGS
jgi:hypothetical protein